jgi:hypothetical protein
MDELPSGQGSHSLTPCRKRAWDGEDDSGQASGEWSWGFGNEAKRMCNSGLEDVLPAMERESGGMTQMMAVPATSPFDGGELWHRGLALPIWPYDSNLTGGFGSLQLDVFSGANQSLDIWGPQNTQLLESFAVDQLGRIAGTGISPMPGLEWNPRPLLEDIEVPELTPNDNANMWLDWDASALQIALPALQSLQSTHGFPAFEAFPPAGFNLPADIAVSVSEERASCLPHEYEQNHRKPGFEDVADETPIFKKEEEKEPLPLVDTTDTDPSGSPQDIGKSEDDFDALSPRETPMSSVDFQSSTAGDDEYDICFGLVSN